MTFFLCVYVFVYVFYMVLTESFYFMAKYICKYQRYARKGKKTASHQGTTTTGLYGFCCTTVIGSLTNLR